MKKNALIQETAFAYQLCTTEPFAKGLISFDSKYRVLLSVRLKEYSTRDYYHTYFASMEGKALNVPFAEYSPDSRFLEYHREVIL